jgi:hypothetical protein
MFLPKCLRGQGAYQSIELGTGRSQPGSNEPAQDCSTPTPICFVFKSSASKGGKPEKKKAKGGADKTAKARADKKKAKSDPTKSKKDYVFEKDPNKTDVENFIDCIENFELMGTCNDDTSSETLIFKSIDFSNLVKLVLFLSKSISGPPAHPPLASHLSFLFFYFF